VVKLESSGGGTERVAGVESSAEARVCRIFGGHERMFADPKGQREVSCPRGRESLQGPFQTVYMAFLSACTPAA
jgi:hypothetical protein